MMQKTMKHILNPELPLRDRLFQLLSTIALAEFVLVTLYTILSGGSSGHIIVMLAGTILFAVTVSLTFRFNYKRLGSTISGMLYFSLYPLTFFSSGGMYGGAPTVFAFALVYVYLVTQKWERVLSLAACVICSGACYVVSYYHPETLTRHTVPMEHAESILSVILVALLICAIFSFVTAVYQTENRIVQEQKVEIEELHRSQKRFFSSMSHEIRTPVNAIIGLNEMNLKEPIPEEVRENSENIEVAGKSLLHTVNEIMDMSRLETSGMEILNKDYRTAAMLSDIAGMVRIQARGKGLEFNLQADPGLPSVLHGDEVRIRQILLNVITNAVKYTKAGSITLTVTGRRDAAGAFRMIYDVTDTGIGIREESIPGLFTAFQRMDANQTHTIEGTGLGLYIVKQLLDLMNGTVQVSSEYGKGSSFIIEIPQEVIDDTPIGTIDLKKKEEIRIGKKETAFDAAGMKILAVDDTPMNLMVVRKLLRDTGAQLETAESGGEALEKTARTRYDVIFMDHQMPEMDGVECLHRIREQENGKCRDSRIVCLTANAGGDIAQEYLREGFDGYLVKPVRGQTLKDELARLMV